jgi:hypothetical protein
VHFRMVHRDWKNEYRSGDCFRRVSAYQLAVESTAWNVKVDPE